VWCFFHAIGSQFAGREVMVLTNNFSQFDDFYCNCVHGHHDAIGTGSKMRYF
jgi:hypothetical protein